MFNIFYSKGTGRIVNIAQSNASSEAMVTRLKQKYELYQTKPFDTPLAGKLMTGELNLKGHRIQDGKIVQVEAKNPTRPSKRAARQPLQKIEKEYLFEGDEVHMTLLYHKKDSILTVHFGDNIEWVDRILYLFFTLEDDPTFFLGQIDFPIKPGSKIFEDVPDLSECGIYTIRHFTNINYKEIE